MGVVTQMLHCLDHEFQRTGKEFDTIEDNSKVAFAAIGNLSQAEAERQDLVWLGNKWRHAAPWLMTWSSRGSNMPLAPMSMKSILIFELFAYISKPQIGLNLPNLAKLLSRVLRTDTRRHNNIVSRYPINRRRNTLAIARLQRIHHSQNL